MKVMQRGKEGTSSRKQGFPSRERQLLFKQIKKLTLREEFEDANDYVNIRRRVRKFLKGNNEMRFGGVTSQEDS